MSELGYNVITIWEKDWDYIVKKTKEIQKLWLKLHPRNKYHLESIKLNKQVKKMEEEIQKHKDTEMDLLLKLLEYEQRMNHLEKQQTTKTKKKEEDEEKDKKIKEQEEELIKLREENIKLMRHIIDKDMKK